MASSEVFVVAMDQANMPVADPMHPATKLAHGLHLYDQMPVITHQAIAPKINFKFCRGLAHNLQENGELFRLPKKHLPMIAPVDDMKKSPFQMSPGKPWHVSSMAGAARDSRRQRACPLFSCPLFSPFLPLFSPYMNRNR
jgi:hypothetical protein